MYRSTVIEYLKKFTPKEIREFNEFVHSPFFNKNQGVTKLFEYLRKRHHTIDSSKLDKKYVFRKIFPGIEYNESFMKTLMFNLQKLIENYFVYTGLKEQHFAEKNLLLEKLIRKDLNRQTERKMRELMKEFEGVKIQDSEYYLDKLTAERLYYYYITRTHFDKLTEFIKQGILNNLTNDLTNFYLLIAFDLYGIILNEQKAYQIELNSEQLAGIITNLKPKNYQNVPMLNLYYNILMMSIKDEASYFYKVVKIVDNNDGYINKEHLIVAFIYLGNYCRRMIWKGKNEFHKELFEVYKIGLEKKLYSKNKEMHARTYRSVVQTALKLKEFAWTKEFIEKYKCELPPGSQDNTYYFSLSLYEFALKNFEISLDLLSKVKYEDGDHKIVLRCLVASLYYELNMEDSLISHIDSFNHFLSNDKLITPERKERFTNFVKYTASLYGLKNKHDMQQLKCLKQKILDDLTVYDKEWLMEKIAELEQNEINV